MDLAKMQQTVINIYKAADSLHITGIQSANLLQFIGAQLDALNREIQAAQEGEKDELQTS